MQGRTREEGFSIPSLEKEEGSITFVTRKKKKRAKSAAKEKVKRKKGTDRNLNPYLLL